MAVLGVIFNVPGEEKIIGITMINYKFTTVLK